MSASVVNMVNDHLRRLDSLRVARELFSDLNYEPVNLQPIDWRSWTDAQRAPLAADPSIIAKSGDFLIIYNQLNSDRLERGKEREVVTRLTRDYPYALYLFSDREESDWRFINVKYEQEETRRRVLRRFTVSRDERASNRLRTVSEQLSHIAIADHEIDRLAPLELQHRQDVAFDVEAVTKNFYTEYHKVFDEVEKSIEGFGEDAERKRLFTQRLFNRLMFIAFVQKKGWLNFSGQQGTDYLTALWSDYERKRRAGDESNFYRNRLKLLFFAGLNTPHMDGDGLTSIRPGGVIQSIIGDVHYLNGGLFEEDDDDKNQDIEIPDQNIHAILSQLFDRFNFTIDESTPLDIEVAVDPEMLGKVFEELVTGRHETGSYYTPKPIVSFMCHEALKGYLGAKLPQESSEGVAKFVDEYDADDIRDPEATLDALRTVTACDPACGSGAYLLGLLQELIELRSALFATRNLDPVSNYERKLEIIQKNLYGVDVDQFAINIARLRLWLSLAVDFTGDRPAPLPNLEFKIEQGDSVLGPRPPEMSLDMMRLNMVREYARLKGDYLSAHSGMKREIFNQIEKQKKSIQSLTPYQHLNSGFDWTVEFAEVMADGGFDVVVANPPYVRHELITEIKPELKRVYGELYSGTADLYVYFYLRAFELLKPHGKLVFISSNKWFRAGYGKKLRAFVGSTASVGSITDFRDLPVFEAASAYPMIFTAEKKGNKRSPVYTEVPSLNDPYPDVLGVIREFGRELPADALTGSDWSFADADTARRIEIMKSRGTTLGEYVHGQIYRGVLTGLNDAFVIDGVTHSRLIDADPQSADIIGRFVTGRDVKRWKPTLRDRWIIFARRGTHIDDFPAIKAHLRNWKEDLAPKSSRSDERGRKPGSYKWYEIQDAMDYYELFSRTKIVFPDIAKELRFAIDYEGCYPGDTTFFIPSHDLFLLGTLNSSVVLELYADISAEIRGGFLRFKPQYVKQIPIPAASKADESAVANLVERCFRRLDDDQSIVEIEAEIDSRVSRIYGLESEG